MNAVIANALFSLYGDGFLETFFNTMDNVFSATLQVLQSNFMTSAFAIFSGISASLIILFFYIDFMDHLSREMISFEVLVSMLIKLMVCIVVCVEIPQLCTWVVQLSDAFFRFTGDFFSSEANANGTDIVLLLPDTEDEFVEAMNNVFWGGSTYSASNGMHKLANTMRQIRFALEHPLWTIESFIIVLVTAILKLVGYFIAISTALVLIARMFFAPIGMINIYRGEYSSGIRYFKSLLSTACSFGVMVAIVGAASLLTQSLISGGVFEALGLEGEGSTETISKEYDDDGSAIYVGDDTGKIYTGKIYDSDSTEEIGKTDMVQDEEGTLTGTTDYLVVINFSDEGVNNLTELTENALNNLGYLDSDDTYLPDEAYQDPDAYEESSDKELLSESSGGYPTYAEITNIFNNTSTGQLYDDDYEDIVAFWGKYSDEIINYSNLDLNGDNQVARISYDTLELINEELGKGQYVSDNDDTKNAAWTKLLENVGTAYSAEKINSLVDNGINTKVEGTKGDNYSKTDTSSYAYSTDDMLLLVDIYWYLNPSTTKTTVKEMHRIVYNTSICDAIHNYCSELKDIMDEISESGGGNIVNSDALTQSEEFQAQLEAQYSEPMNLALNFRTVFAALVPQIAAIVGMAGATRYINEAIG